MDQLAADCVRNFEDFRAPLTDADIERRRQSKLTPKQDERLLTFGYPHIFDDFHFHMTLAGPLEDAEQEAVAGMLRREAGSLDGQPLHVDAVALYQQPDRDSPFIQTAPFPFHDRDAQFVLEKGDEPIDRLIQSVGVDQAAHIIAFDPVGIGPIETALDDICSLTPARRQPFGQNLTRRGDDNDPNRRPLPSRKVNDLS